MKGYRFRTKTSEGYTSQTSVYIKNNVVQIRCTLFASAPEHNDIVLRKIWGVYYVKRMIAFQVSTFAEINNCVIRLLNESK